MWRQRSEGARRGDVQAGAGCLVVRLAEEAWVYVDSLSPGLGEQGCQPRLYFPVMAENV